MDTIMEVLKTIGEIAIICMIIGTKNKVDRIHDYLDKKDKTFKTE